MKSGFAIFGLERIPEQISDDEKSGQPYLFRKYPEQFESYIKAHDELEKIMGGKSPFVHYKSTRYVIMEIYSQ
ncbi:MAG TPA: hypothetical protein VIH86_05430 [Puia sp.]